ncbi:MAG: hypothetical protein GX335_09570, partial [Firmicutes bacterium]|nr:hypothetical protein [Bacillota bacterium]
TLLHVLRYLGYGFPRGSGLPAPQSRYELEAELSFDQNLYQLSLQGYGEPVLEKIGGKNPSLQEVRELYPLDGFTYRQLFTITLDELGPVRNLPREDHYRLQSVLLGAGLKDVMLLPQLARKFFNQARQIGGIKGDPQVAQFKAYAENIKKGQVLRGKGLRQEEEYRAKQKKLQLVQEEIKELSLKLEELDRQAIRLDLIKNNFEKYLDWIQLEAELEQKQDYYWRGGPSEYELERIEVLQAELESVEQEIQEKEIELGLSAAGRELLLSRAGDLASLKAGISGLKERLRLVLKNRQNFQDKEKVLAAGIKEVNVDWEKGRARKIREIRTDLLQSERIGQLIKEYQDLQSKAEARATELNRLYAEKYTLEKETAVFKEDKIKTGIKQYYFLSLAFILGGLLLSVFNPSFGILLGISGAFGAAVLAVLKAGENREIEALIIKQKERITELLTAIRQEEKSAREEEPALKRAEEELNSLKKAMGMEPGDPFQALPAHLLRIKRLQDGFDELDSLNREFEAERSYLQTELRRYKQFLIQLEKGKDVQELPHFDPGGDLEQEAWDLIQTKLEQWAKRLGQAQELRILEEKAQARIDQIIKMMEGFSLGEPLDFQSKTALFLVQGRKALEYDKLRGKKEDLQRTILGSLASDAVRQAFGGKEGSTPADEEQLLSLFKSECSSFGVKGELAKVYGLVLQKRDEKRGKLKDLKELEQRLLLELEQLAAIENLVQGRREIDQNRSKLRPLAEDYALYMAAAFLLEEVERRVLEGMRENVMDGAGRIFSRITSGDYAGIYPADSFSESDFAAIAREDARPETIDMLSRGTREQLYLAVRISRILEIKPALPLIIDDSFANFDSRHLEQSLGLLGEMAKTHQIFVLTCHPRLVQNIGRLGTNAQYWKLIDGKFYPSRCEKLQEHLGRGN